MRVQAQILFLCCIRFDLFPVPGWT